MLRGVRFAARLGFVIEPATLAAMQEYASCVSHISAERIRDEVVGIMTSGAPRRGLELLIHQGC